MSLAQRMHFLQDMFQMTAVAQVSVINHYHINVLHLFFRDPVLKSSKKKRNASFRSRLIREKAFSFLEF